jgi:phosphate transport system permease protein
MATETDRPGGLVDLGEVSRLRGAVFENVTRAASAVGVVALFLLLVYVAWDAFQPATADPAWYGLLFVTFLVPTALAWVFVRRRDGTRVALRGVGATLAGLALATTLVLWLGGQLALLVVGGGLAPTMAFLAVLRTRRDALTVGLGTAAVAVAGGGLASVLTFFIGPQATLVVAVAVGVPAALLTRFFLARPAVGSVGVHAIGAAILGVGAATLAVEGAAILLNVEAGTTAVGTYALGAVLAVGVYAIYTRTHRTRGYLGLFAPFVLLSGALAGYLFHRAYVVVAPVTPLLYGVTAGLPALYVAVRALDERDAGRAGLLLPLVPVVGAVFVFAFHRRFVVLAPTVALAFALAVALALGTYGWYARASEPAGAAGLALPVVAGGGLLAGVLVARTLGVAGPETWLDVTFLTQGAHYEPTLTGIHPALIGSLYLMAVVTFVAFPVGVGAAIYLEEYAPDNRWTRFLEVNIANLAGVPSVVYGLLGVGVFVRYGGLRLGAVVAGGFTLALLVLPIVIIASQEAIRAVPDSLRQASYGMGATRWQTVRNVVLPRALPGILTGTILALGRAVGETAPLLMVGLAAIGGVPDSLTGQGTAMPLQVFAWAQDARELFRTHVAAAGAMTLLVVLLAMNAVAIIIRNKYQREQ